MIERTDSRAVKYLLLLVLAALSLPGSAASRTLANEPAVCFLDAPCALDAPATRATPAAVIGDDGRGTPFIVNKSDNICGLDEPRQLTNPAVVDYDVLLAATPEAKKIKKDKIDPASSEGITMIMKGRARVLKACESVRQARGNCSVWKSIKRRNKRAISNITDSVKRLL